VAAACKPRSAPSSAGGVAWTGATVAYDAVTNRFNLVSGQVPARGRWPSVPGAGTDLAPSWAGPPRPAASSTTARQSKRSRACLSASAELSNNFATFQFLPALSQAQVVEAASWNKAQNNMFMYLPRTDAASAAALSAALIGTGGVGLTLSPLATEYPEMLPAMVLASTDYTRRNATQNYMFQQAGS
jgi:hypothetical protein